MRILWLSMSPSLYKTPKTGYNGIGWIASLEMYLKSRKEIDLGIAFYLNDNDEKIKSDNVTYYPIKRKNKIKDKVQRWLVSNKSDQVDMLRILKVINDFKPEIIHIFGSETNFGLVSKYTKIPVVIHLQGILNPYINAWYPAGFSSFDFLKYNSLNLKKIILDFWMYHANRRMALRELDILRNCKNFLGRTEWDKSVSKLLSPESNYYYCGEILRTVFYDNKFIDNRINTYKFVIHTTISTPLYKGFDLILKTAKLLVSETQLKFEWRVFGLNDVSFFEKKFNIRCKDVNIKIMGVVTANELKDSLLTANVYVHPSYIDNSPNSVCEAQICGIPVIATDVGGVTSLVKHNMSGIIIPANDPFLLAYNLNFLANNKNTADELGMISKEIASKRHDPKSIINDLVLNYQNIINNNKLI